MNGNRVVVGTLRGFDQFMNLVVDNTVEVNSNEKNDIGMVVSSSYNISLYFTLRVKNIHIDHFHTLLKWKASIIFVIF